MPKIPMKKIVSHHGVYYVEIDYSKGNYTAVTLCNQEKELLLYRNYVQADTDFISVVREVIDDYEESLNMSETIFKEWDGDLRKVNKPLW